VIKIIQIEPEFAGETASTVVFGRVVGLHMKDEYIDAEGRFDTVKARPVTRLGGLQYGALGEVIEVASAFRKRQ
jgi:flavin reductase (DIM6/NTAB) family NADH-FMN oxidoreductase RutF